MKKHEYVEALRELADFVESRHFPDTWKEHAWDESSFSSPRLTFYLGQPDAFKKFSGLIGSFTKSATEGYLTSAKTLHRGAMISVKGRRDTICERVKVGTKIIPASEEKIIPAKPETIEDIYEWKCPESFIDPIRARNEVAVQEEVKP